MLANIMPQIICDNLSLTGAREMGEKAHVEEMRVNSQNLFL